MHRDFVAPPVPSLLPENQAEKELVVLLKDG